MIKDLYPKKCSGQGMINDQMLQQPPPPPKKNDDVLVQCSMTTALLQYFPTNWRLANVIIISKPRKSLEEHALY